MAKRTSSLKCFLAELYSICITVWPVERAGGTSTFWVSHGPSGSRPVTTDNKATVLRNITFSTRNRCSHPFTLRYSTRAHGFIDNLILSAANEALPEDIGRYNDYGHEVTFSFRPRPSGIYTMSFDVLGGFGSG